MIKGDKIKVVGNVGKIKPPTNLPTSANPFATLVSTKSAGDVVLLATSSSGYYKVEWWDNTSSVEANDSVPYKGTGDAGAKTIRVYACDENGNPSGDLIGLNIPFNDLTSLDVSGLTALTSLDCYANALTSLDVSGLTVLTSLNCGDNALTSLDVSGLTVLTSLNCGDNALTSLDVSGLTVLTSLNIPFNALTSLRAVGVAFSGYSTFPSPIGIFGGASLSNNNLSAAALNQFYSDIAPNAGFIRVGGNPGTESDDPTIATAKGYTVYDF